MIHVVLDTNIYRSNPNRDNLYFKALEKLSMAGSLCLHIPYVVLREFQTHQREIYEKDLAKAISGLSGLSRKLLDKDVQQKIYATESGLKGDAENILISAENQIINWADNIGAKIHPLCLDQASLALEAYFQGKPPLKSVKNREDIPDSFIVQSIYKLNSEAKCIYLVTGDGKVRDTFSEEELVSTYESLAGFLETQLIQDELKEVDLIGNIGPIVTAVQKFEGESSEIECFLSNNIGESVVSRTFFDPSIPDDNHEATVNSYGEAEDIQLDLTEIGYYGNGQFGIPFTLKIVVLADYYIFKSDYYCMDEENIPSVTDHNEHYFEAEEEFELCVSGLVSITVDRDNINLNDFSESILKDSFEIDEINNIELC